MPVAHRELDGRSGVVLVTGVAGRAGPNWERAVADYAAEFNEKGWLPLLLREYVEVWR